MNTDDPHLKCHLMSQIILHICPHHHVVVLNLRCRRSCHNANENLRNNSPQQTVHYGRRQGRVLACVDAERNLYRILEGQIVSAPGGGTKHMAIWILGVDPEMDGQQLASIEL